MQSMWLDMETGFKCYMLSARALQLANSTDTWRLISLTGASRLLNYAPTLFAELSFIKFTKLLYSKSLMLLKGIPW